MSKTVSHWRHHTSTFLAGLLFGLGLSLSEMTNPKRVLGFLDVSDSWDPVLLMVMAGALLVTLPGFQWIIRRGRPLLAESLQLPSSTLVDARLVLGACLFGIGWGLAGLCPGPAIVALVTLDTRVILFMLAMLAGMLLHHFLQKLL